MRKPKNISGQRFGMLVALEYEKGGKWRCLCDCGNIRIVNTGNLTNGRWVSCGCKTDFDRKCPTCGSQFEGTKTQRYCSEKCRTSATKTVISVPVTDFEKELIAVLAHSVGTPITKYIRDLCAAQTRQKPMPFGQP